MQGAPDLRALVQGQDHALLQVEPVIGADGHAQQGQPTDGKHAAEQRQGLPAARAHRPNHRGGAAVRGWTGQTLRWELCLGR